MKKFFDLWVYSYPSLKKLIMEFKIAFFITFVSVSNVLANPTYSIDVNRVISIQADNELITNILPELFKGTNANYVVFNRKILLTTDSLDYKLLANTSGPEPQQKQITGTIMDEKGNSLPGVTVVVKGTTLGTQTDASGKYSIVLPNENAVLIFSFIGYNSQNVTPAGKTTIDVKMVLATQNLEEVVVIGYGTVKKSDLTGSVTSIKTGELQTGAFNSLDQQLSGKAAGVQITQISGQPGSGTTIRIRGTNSIMGNNEPLYVIDGIPYGNNFGPDINPNDILSVEILKDASSTAIYGSRGASGVVLITTKQGSTGQTKISFDTYCGVDVLAKKIDLLNAEQLAVIHKRAIANGVTQYYNSDTIHGPGIDWQNKIYKAAPTESYQLAISGGNPNLTYFFSGNYLDQEGILINTGYNRYALRANIKSKVNDKITFGIGLYMSKSLEKMNESSVGSALLINPNMPLTDGSGGYPIDADPTGRTGSNNPVGTALLEINENNNYKILSNIFGEYSILKNLVLKTSFGANILNDKSNFFAPNGTFTGQQSKIIAKIGYDNSFYWVSSNTLIYNESFGENHKLEAMIGFTAEKNRTESVSASSDNYVTGYPLYNSLQSGQSQSASSSLNENQLASFLARLNYNFKDKYLVTISGRYDGSSRFGIANKWAFFPSGALAWKVSNEDFMKNFIAINNLKLRASIGSSGEQAIPNYQSLASLSPASVMLGNSFMIGFIPNRLASPNLKWEKTTQYDFGIDAGFLKGRMNLTADFYYKITTGLLMNVALPQSTGYSSILNNVGSIENKGMEYNLNTLNTTGTFIWTTDFNISFNRNKVLNLGYNPNGTKVERIIAPVGGSGLGSANAAQSALLVGEPIGGAYGYVFEGTYKSIEEIANSPEPEKLPGDPKYADLNGDGVVNADDRRMISKAEPDFIGGLTNKFSYKNLELSIFLQFVVGFQLYDYNHFYWSYIDGINNTQPWALNSWSTENPTSNIPRAGYDVRTKALSTWNVENASYLRGKNITLSYNLSIEKWGIHTCKIYFSIDNAFTITKYSGYNPDVSKFGTNSIASGFDGQAYPLAKSFLLGLKMEF